MNLDNRSRSRVHDNADPVEPSAECKAPWTTLLASTNHFHSVGAPSSTRIGSETTLGLSKGLFVWCDVTRDRKLKLAVLHVLKPITTYRQGLINVSARLSRNYMHHDVYPVPASSSNNCSNSKSALNDEWLLLSPKGEISFAPPGIVHDVFYRASVQSARVETNFQSVIVQL